MLRFISVLFLVAACSTQPAPITGDDYARLLSPGAQTRAVVDSALPKMLEENLILERKILQRGRPLSSIEARRARALGVNNTSKVRILVVTTIPSRNTFAKVNAELGGATSLGIGSEVGGLTTGYGILVARNYADKDWLIAHELVHVAQFEALGREPMLRRILTERTILKDKLIPIEREAIAKSSMLMGREVPEYVNSSPNKWITLPLR